MHLAQELGKLFSPAFLIESAVACAFPEFIERDHERTALAKQVGGLQPVVEISPGIAAVGYHDTYRALGVEKLVQRLVFVLPGKVPDV